MKNLRSLKSVFIALIVLLAIAGCAETSKVEATGQGTVRGIHANVTAPELNFLIEERSIGAADFKQSVGFTEFDDLTYNFNFDFFIPGEEDPLRLVTQFIDVIADTEYTLVLGGTIAAPTLTMWEEPEREWAEGATDYEADFVHLSPALGEVDLYYLPFGTVPAQGLAVATLNYGDRIPYQEFPEGGRDIFITLKDDPTNYLFRSPTISSPTATRVTIAIFDSDPTITAGISVNLISATGESAAIQDIGVPPVFRLFHAAFGTTNVDAFLNSDFGAIIFQNVGIGDLTAYIDIASAVSLLTVTDTGNSGAPVHEEEIGIGGNSIHTVMFVGEPGSLSYLNSRDDGRPLETSPQVRFTNVSANVGAVSIYMQPPGTIIDETTPIQLIGLPELFSTGFMRPVAGSYEITITALTDIVPIAAPLTIDIANGDIVDFAIMDTADPAVVELFTLSSTIP